MRVLMVIPPYVPSYFNAGHHLPLFQVGAYVRRETGSEVVCRDLAALNASWRDVCELLTGSFDAAVLLNDFDGVDGFGRFVSYAHELAPGMPLATFGRASKQVPGFFERFGFDGIATDGDYEVSIRSWLGSLDGTASPRGLRIAAPGGYVGTPSAGYLDAAEWALPDVEEIPYAAYDRLYEDDLDKFCGIPGRRELVVPVARGCPVGCYFCDVPSMQGLADRRLTVERVLTYIDDALGRGPFEYVSFYAPTFTLRRGWVVELCERLEQRPPIPWKCVTTTKHLDAELVSRMGRAGCVRISVGVETMTPGAEKALPPQKRDQRRRVDAVLDWCAAAGIELNCFLVMGMAGDDADAARATIEHLLERGARVRPTALTLYDGMSETMSVAEFASYNRQTFAAGLLPESEARRYYDLMYSNGEDRPTEVWTRVPLRREIAPPSRP